MTDKIEPALSAEEWKKARDEGATHHDECFWLDNRFSVSASLYDGELIIATENGNSVGSIDRPAALIALANAALPDSDRRKITREKIAVIRQCAFDNLPYLAGAVAKAMVEFADALESYLPPEGRSAAIHFPTL